MRTTSHISIALIILAYSGISHAQTPFVPYRSGDLWGFCRPDKEIVITPQYDDARPLIGNFGAVAIGRRYALLDIRRNRLVTTAIFDEIRIHRPRLYSHARPLKRFFKIHMKGFQGVIDTLGQIVVPPEYDDITVYGDDQTFFPVERLNPTKAMREGWLTWRGPYSEGLIAYGGRVHIPPIFDDVRALPDGVGSVGLNGIGKQFVTADGMPPLDTVFEALKLVIPRHPVVLFKKNDKWGALDYQGNILVAAEYDSIDHRFWKGLAPIKRDGKWGFLNTEGQIVIPIMYDRVRSFKEGFSAVSASGKWGVIDTTGAIKVPHRFDRIEPTSSWVFDDNGRWTARAWLNGKWGYIDAEGRTIIPIRYDEIGWFQDGLGLVKREGKYGLIDTSGNETYPAAYDWIYDNLEDYRIEGTEYLMIKRGDFYGIVGPNDTVIVPPEYDEIEVTRYAGDPWAVKRDGKWGVLDTSGNLIVPFLYDGIDTIDDGLITVSLDGKFGVIDRKGDIRIPFVYDRTTRIRDGLLTAMKDDKWGIIDTTSAVIIPFEYDHIAHRPPVLIARQNESFTLFNRNGRQLTESVYDSLESWNDLVIFERDGYYGVMDVQGREIIPAILTELDGFEYDFLIGIGPERNWYIGPHGERYWED